MPFLERKMGLERLSPGMLAWLAATGAVLCAELRVCAGQQNMNESQVSFPICLYILTLRFVMPLRKYIRIHIFQMGR